MRRRRYQSSSGLFRSTTVPQLPNPGTPFLPTFLNFDPRKIHNIPPAQGITRVLLFIKKIYPQKWAKQPMASWCGPFFSHQNLHAPMFEQGVHRDFRKILWTRNIIGSNHGKYQLSLASASTASTATTTAPLSITPTIMTAAAPEA